ncbi:MAG: hypothetical protein V1773_12830 [bacterium]
MNYNKFDNMVIEKLQFYVYFLIDPRSKKVFYVGKGNGNRIFDHLNLAIETPKESDKLEIIRQIIYEGKEVELYILRHGLDESTAYKVESEIIDFIGLENITNKVNGHNSNIKTIDEINILYKAEEIEISVPAMIIIVNKHFNKNMPEDKIYEITRKAWVVGKRREKAKYAFCVYKGIIREVYQINAWFNVEGRRWGFDGVKAEHSIRELFIHKKIQEQLLKKGASNPIKYVNC